MAEIQAISTTLVQARSHNNSDVVPRMDLTPWDLQLLEVETIQKGLLFHNPESQDTYIQHLKDSLSSTLDFFVPLAGRLAISEHDDDILDSIYVPRVVHSLFPLNGVKNIEGTSKPLLAVQVTELEDGIFIGCSINHSVVDGRSFWHFFNSWAEISRGLGRISKLPALERWFLEGIEQPIRFLFTKENQNSDGLIQPLAPPPERVFHFTKGKISQLKSKANAEVNYTNKISSLQALLTHVWRSAIRNQRLDPKEDVSFFVIIGARPRILNPPLPESYFGNAVHIGKMTKKVGEFLEEGLGNTALEMNKMISLHTEEKIKDFLKSWIKKPEFLRVSGVRSDNRLVTSSSPRFDIYGNDFGWGKPVAVRSGSANKARGKLTVYPGVEEGSIDIELCLRFEVLEALANDPDFMNFASI
ncbi:uncharacterized acetyltransferase At3g50280-like isoform X2 [Prosopis cineraria]|uniref:uncharacterized acetyltransferase At3g50280-like isoform X2 n=1 Tax=Prosopis cineraria TaxID=364024 RepID=UPI00240EC786|nr:uncharacterized acetyltransferase At3g50280-like isoform X2 [Prosopis cineraria]XP_054800266.1 uncharacterized acetyltransferase At3g50280-like isoform X2 [Prosopis cineraria]